MKNIVILLMLLVLTSCDMYMNPKITVIDNNGKIITFHDEYAVNYRSITDSVIVKCIDADTYSIYSIYKHGMEVPDFYFGKYYNYSTKDNSGYFVSYRIAKILR